VTNEAALESKLADAKQAYRDNPGDEKAKARFRKAADAVVEERQSRRDAGVTIGGDAKQSNGKES
jgi:hypothetical protein